MNHAYACHSPLSFTFLTWLNILHYWHVWLCLNFCKPIHILFLMIMTSGTISINPSLYWSIISRELKTFFFQILSSKLIPVFESYDVKSRKIWALKFRLKILQNYARQSQVEGHGSRLLCRFHRFRILIPLPFCNCSDNTGSYDTPAKYRKR